MRIGLNSRTSSRSCGIDAYSLEIILLPELPKSFTYELSGKEQISVLVDC